MARTLGKKLGRPRLSDEERLRRGGWRKDRYGPRPPVMLSAVPRVIASAGSVPPSDLPDRATGVNVVAAIVAQFVVDDPIAGVHLSSIATAVDRRAAINEMLDGPDGLLAQVALGKVSSSAVLTLLRAHRDCCEQIDRAHIALELEPDAVPQHQPGFAS